MEATTSLLSTRHTDEERTQTTHNILVSLHKITTVQFIRCIYPEFLHWGMCCRGCFFLSTQYSVLPYCYGQWAIKKYSFNFWKILYISAISLKCICQMNKTDYFNIFLKIHYKLLIYLIYTVICKYLLACHPRFTHFYLVTIHIIRNYLFLSANL